MASGWPLAAGESWIAWRDAWWLWSHHPGVEAAATAALLRWTLPQTPVRPLIERNWEAIDQGDDWQPLADWLASTRAPGPGTDC